MRHKDYAKNTRLHAPGKADNKLSLSTQSVSILLRSRQPFAFLQLQGF